MKLRDHPLVRHRGLPSWPPVWTQGNGDRDTVRKTLRGEVGVLKYVHANPEVSNKAFLVVEYEREKYVGTLIVDHLTFFSQVIRILRTQTGRTIKQIGDLDVSHML